MSIQLHPCTRGVQRHELDIKDTLQVRTWLKSHFIHNVSGFLELFLSCGKEKERERERENKEEEEEEEEEEEFDVSYSHPVLVIEN